MRHCKGVRERATLDAQAARSSLNGGNDVAAILGRQEKLRGTYR